MKTVFYTAPFIVLAFFAGMAVAPQQVPLGSVASENTAKKKLMKDNIWLSERLKETLTIDLSIGTTGEWTEAAIDVANEKGVTPSEIVSHGSINGALRAKAAATSMLCNNPNSTAVIKGENLVRP